MILEVGKAGKCRFVRGIKKTNIFEIGEYGMVVERDKHAISLYVTNNRCSEIFCVVPLGDGRKLLKQKANFIAAAYTRDILLLDAGEIMVIVDYAEKKVAVNKPEIPVEGRNEWADARMPWEPYFNAMFGLPVGESEMAAAEALRSRENAQALPEVEEEVPQENTQEKFWTWFAENEDDIVDKTMEGGEEAEIITARLRVRLAVVFPYEKPENIEFSLGGDGEKNRLAVYHFNNERMKADAEKLVQAMPAELAERWICETEA